MRQFSVCLLKARGASRARRIVVIVQHDQLSAMRTRLVAPLLTRDDVSSVALLTPEVRFQDQTLFLGLHQLVTVDLRDLGDAIGQLDLHDQVVRGIDLLITGV